MLNRVISAFFSRLSKLSRVVEPGEVDVLPTEPAARPGARTGTCPGTWWLRRASFNGEGWLIMWENHGKTIGKP